MSKINKDIVNKAAIDTNALQSGGILLPEQAKKFLKQTMEATPLTKLVRHEMRISRKGELDKIGVAGRITRKKTEGSDNGYRAGVAFDKVEYSTVAVRLPWETTEESLRENIEGESMEQIITDLMTAQLGIDLEDLCLNADVDTASTDPDYEFLSITDGWLKKLKNGAHVVDRSSVNSGALGLDVFYEGSRAVPSKYHNGKLRWLLSPNMRSYWEQYILTQAATAGGIVTDKRVENPGAIPCVEVPRMPDDCIVLTDPLNLIIVNTYTVKIRKTTEGKEAVMEDKRFYVVHLDFDAIIEELDAAAIIIGLDPESGL